VGWFDVDKLGKTLTSCKNGVYYNSYPKLILYLYRGFPQVFLGLGICFKRHI